MTKTTKRYIASSVITFISSFLAALALSFDTMVTLSEEALYSALLAAVCAGFRALVKYLNETFVHKA